MKDKYQITFKRAKTYPLEYVNLVLDAFEAWINEVDTEIVLYNFCREYDCFLRRSRIQWDRFVEQEGFSLKTPSEVLDTEAKDLILDLLPIFSMSRNEKLIEQLKKMSFYPVVQNHFIYGNELEKSLEKFIAKINQGKDEYVGLYFLAHLIALIKCSLIIEENLGYVKGYKNREPVVISKINAENLKRTFRKGRRPGYLMTSKIRRYYLQFEVTEKLFTFGNLLAKRNHSGTYNVQYLSALFFKLIRDNIQKEEFSDNEIIVCLFDVFKVLFAEQNPHKSEAEWLMQSQTLKSKNAPKGDNFRSYQINWVKRIIGYSSLKKRFEGDSDYNNPNPEINPRNVLDAFL